MGQGLASRRRLRTERVARVTMTNGPMKLFSRCARFAGPLLVLTLLAGCGLADAPVINPKGPIALAERNLLLLALGLMMIVVIPVFVMTALFVWRYRTGSGRGAYTPDWEGSNAVEAVIWAIPAVIVIILAWLVWHETHKLDPYAELGKNSFEVEVVAQDWKWLFIYPELGVASVNELVFPQDRPLKLKITSDTVMNSFWIPALGGQIYAMAGMTSQLNLIASEPGAFRGRNTMYSGDGFSDQHFTARALDEADFAAWRDKVEATDTALDARAYVELVKPSAANPVTYYSTYEPNLFDLVLRKYAQNPGEYESEAAAIICGGAA